MNYSSICEKFVDIINLSSIFFKGQTNQFTFMVQLAYIVRFIILQSYFPFVKRQSQNINLYLLRFYRMLLICRDLNLKSYMHKNNHKGFIGQKYF